MWVIVLGLSGIGLACSAVAAVECITDVKYACTDTTDDMVSALRVLDVVRAVCGVLLCAVVAWGHSNQRMDKNAYKVYWSNIAAVLLLTLTCLFLGVVQQSDACQKCIEGGRSTTDFQDDLNAMLGGTDIGGTCLSTLTERDFNVPDMYCRDRIEMTVSQCSQSVGLPATIYAERCLVYACSNLVPGYTFRYLYGVVGMSCQIIACLTLMLSDTLIQPHDDGYTPLGQQDTADSDVNEQPSMPRPVLLRNRTTAKRTTDEIHF